MLIKKIQSKVAVRTTAIFIFAAFLVVGLGGASIVGPFPELLVRRVVVDIPATQTLKELSRLGFIGKISQSTIEDLLSYQVESGKTLAKILRDPAWLEKLGLSADVFKATWYASNPFELLPVDLQAAIRRSNTPLASRSGVNRWLLSQNAPDRWTEAMRLALIETTPENLWRASRGKRPFAKNGQYLQPIVIERENGKFDTFDGHIATDPRYIPTNSRVLILVKINEEEKILRVKATDIGQAIKGRHVDLPIKIKPSFSKDHGIEFPGKIIRNPTIVILSPVKKVNRGQKV